MILPVLSGSHVNKINTQMAGILNVTNKLPKTKHFLNIDVNQWSCEVVTTHGGNHEFINF